MDITYETILDVLCNKMNFPSPKYIFTYSDTFPVKFNNFLTDKFYRYGITVYNKNKNNISFWSSILTLLNGDFVTTFNNDEESCINDFKNQLLEKYKKMKLDKSIRKIDKIDIRERFKLEPDNAIMQYVVDILDINLFIFDFKNENIKVIYSKNTLNPFKQSCLLANYENYYEPILCSISNKEKNKRLFNYNDNIIKKIVSDNALKSINKQLVISNYRDVLGMEKRKILKNDNEKLEDSDSTVKTEDSEIFIKQTTRKKKNK